MGSPDNQIKQSIDNASLIVVALIYWLVVMPKGIQDALALNISSTLLVLNAIALILFQFIALFFSRVTLFGGIKYGHIEIKRSVEIILYSIVISAIISSIAVAIQYLPYYDKEGDAMIKAMLIFPLFFLVFTLILMPSSISINNSLAVLRSAHPKLKQPNKR